MPTCATVVSLSVLLQNNSFCRSNRRQLLPRCRRAHGGWHRKGPKSVQPLAAQVGVAPKNGEIGASLRRKAKDFSTALEMTTRRSRVKPGMTWIRSAATRHQARGGASARLLQEVEAAKPPAVKRSGGRMPPSQGAPRSGGGLKV